MANRQPKYASRCYTGDGGMDRRVIELADGRVRFETRSTSTREPFGNPRSQSARFTGLVYDEIDPDTGRLMSGSFRGMLWK